jgi:hypothetical protein
MDIPLTAIQQVFLQKETRECKGDRLNVSKCSRFEMSPMKWINTATFRNEPRKRKYTSWDMYYDKEGEPAFYWRNFKSENPGGKLGNGHKLCHKIKTVNYCI